MRGGFFAAMGRKAQSGPLWAHFAQIARLSLAVSPLPLSSASIVSAASESRDGMALRGPEAPHLRVVNMPVACLLPNYATAREHLARLVEQDCVPKYATPLRAHEPGAPQTRSLFRPTLQLGRLLAQRPSACKLASFQRWGSSWQRIILRRMARSSPSAYSHRKFRQWLTYRVGAFICLAELHRSLRCALCRMLVWACVGIVIVSCKKAWGLVDFPFAFDYLPV